MSFTFTEQDMINAIKANGWETLWSDNNWIKSEWNYDKTKNVDNMGHTLEHAFKRLLRDNNIR